MVWWLRAIGATLACALLAGLVFFMLLGVWGLVFAPVLRLDSASFLIVVALAGSTALTIIAYRAWYRRFSSRR